MNKSGTGASTWEIVPLDPNYIPSSEASSTALKELDAVVEDVEECYQWTHDYVQVVGLLDSDGQEITCPSCAEKKFLNEAGVWSLNEMLSVEPPDKIELTMDCCGSIAMLSSVNCGESPRFARFGITITHRSGKLGNPILKNLG